MATTLKPTVSKSILIGSKAGFLADKEGQYCKNVKIVPFHNREQILHECDLGNSRTILPVEICEQRLVLENKGWLRRQSVQFLLSDWETIANCHNKIAFARELKRLDLEKFIPRTLHQIEAPCIVKKAEDAWGQNSFLVLSPQDEAAAKLRFDAADFIFQEYIPGPSEYATHVLANLGKVIWISTIKHIHDQDFYIRGINKGVLRSESVKTESNVRDAIETILSAIKYSGICCVDYKLTKDQRPLIFEINPRLGGSLANNPTLLVDCMHHYKREVERSLSRFIVKSWRSFFTLNRWSRLLFQT